MIAAAPLAAMAAACGVLAAWDALGAVERAALPAAAARLLAPLRAAGRRGAQPTSPELRRLAAVGTLTLLAAGWLLAGPWVGSALAGGGPWTARALVRARRRRWRAELAAGAPAVARALADALAGGAAVRGALEQTARTGGLAGAAAVELERAAAALALGEPTEAVLRDVARRAHDPAYDTIVAAILLQRRAGGDLAGLLRVVAANAEAAGRARAEARSITAQARFTALVVALLPLGGLALAELADPGYVGALLGAPLTAALVAAAAVLQTVAVVLVRRIARVPA